MRSEFLSFNIVTAWFAEIPIMRKSIAQTKV